MEISVKLFATLRQYLPSDAQEGICVMQVAAGTRVIDVFSQLGVPVERPGFAVVLVNGLQVDLNRVLQEHDVVSAFPAMAGGL